MRLRISQIDAIGGADEAELVVGEFGEITQVVSTADNDSPTEITSFNPDTGVLTFVHDNGAVSEIRGFPRPSDILPGDKGKRGPRGLPGIDGRTGRDGNTGRVGCDGGPGATGHTGDDGEDGEDGPQGPRGVYGPLGEDGEGGYEGNQGPTGADGPVGPRGPSCRIGKRGAAGPAPIGTAVFSSTIPTNPAVFLWLVPFDMNSGVRPTVPKWTDIVVKVQPATVVARRVGDTLTYMATFDVKATAIGGSGQYEFTWTVPEVTGVSVKPNGLSLTVLYSKRIPDSSYPGELFTVKLSVRDVGRPGKPSFASTAQVRIKV